MGLVHVCWADALHSRVLEDLAQHRGPTECRAIFEPVKFLFTRIGAHQLVLRTAEPLERTACEH